MAPGVAALALPSILYYRAMRFTGIPVFLDRRGIVPRVASLLGERHLMACDDAGVRRTYDFFASSYDDFNHAYMNVRWTARLLGRAEAAGLVGDRLLDVGCGTGHSFIPMLDRGWCATGCISRLQCSSLHGTKARPAYGWS